MVSVVENWLSQYQRGMKLATMYSSFFPATEDPPYSDQDDRVTFSSNNQVNYLTARQHLINVRNNIVSYI